jgi:hypothetical protein
LAAVLPVTGAIGAADAALAISALQHAAAATSSFILLMAFSSLDAPLKMQRKKIFGGTWSIR